MFIYSHHRKKGGTGEAKKGAAKKLQAASEDEDNAAEKPVPEQVVAQKEESADADSGSGEGFPSLRANPGGSDVAELANGKSLKSFRN